MTHQTPELTAREQAELLAAQRYPTSDDHPSPRAMAGKRDAFLAGYLVRDAQATGTGQRREVPPAGLCGDRRDHTPHTLAYVAVVNGPMRCHADQSRRVPNRIPQPQHTEGADHG